jgi:hypothetical protein
MKMNRVVALIGFLLYIGSFFLLAVSETTATASTEGFKGYSCAFLALISPWGHGGMEMLHDKPLAYFSVLVSGWINPVFLITAVMLWIRPHGRAGAFLRIVTVLMFPAVWLAFKEMQLRPRAGYWLWTAGMLLVLFSTMLARKERDVNVAAVAA